MKTSIKLFLIILTLISVSKAQIIFQQVPNIVDARSAAMGNTEIINSNGSNALYSNPGILATLKTVTIQAGGSAFIGNSSYELADQYLKNHEEKFQLKPKLTHFAVAYPYTLPGSETNITFAAGYFSYYNYSTKKNLEIVYEEEGHTLNKEEISEGGLNLLSLGASVNFLKRFNVGLSYNKSFMTNFIYTFEEDDWGEKDAGKLDYSYDDVSFFKFGVFAEVTDELSLGFTYNSGFQFKTEKVKVTNKYGEPLGSTEFEHKYTYPSYYSFGGGFRVSKEFLVTAEYQDRPFSQYEIDNDPIKMSDGGCYRLGVELNYGATPIRLGIFNESLHYETEDNSEEPVTITGLTGGIGLNIRNFTLDLAAQYSFYSYERKYETKVYETDINLYNFFASIKYSL